MLTNIIKNENIVKTIKVEPESFLLELCRIGAGGGCGGVKSILPVLCMEFCDGGDLRRALDNSENTCCGFNEVEVRSILKALRNAISYLHSLKITHRDIKPENIVLKRFENQTIYKLTDLGVAKELDRNSLNASFVGTMEYLAPELLQGGKYSNSVDYWSLGIIAFEMICGVRPFLPHCPIARWMVYAQKKNSEHICITEDNDGNYKYHKNVLEENRTSKNLLKYLEKWLSIALEWNPKQRGFEFLITNNTKPEIEKPSQNLRIFTILDEALDRKFLNIFSLYNYCFYTFEITETTSMNALLQMISTETGITLPDLELVLPVNHQLDRIDDQTRPIDLFMSSLIDLPMLYVLKNGTIYNAVVAPPIPKLVQDVFKDTKVKLKPHSLRQFARNAVFFVHNEQRFYGTLLNAIKTYAMYLNDRIIKFKVNIIQMLRNCFTMRGAMGQFNETLEFTKAKFDGILSQNYTEQCLKVESNINALCEASEKISRRYDSALRRCQEALNSEILKKEIEDVYNVKVLNVQFNLIRTQIAERKVIDEKSHINILNSVYGCLKKRDKILMGSSLQDLNKRLVHVKVEMMEIMKASEMAESTRNSLKRALYKLSHQHQEIIWNLIPSTSTYGARPPSEYLPDFEGILPPITSNPQNNINFKIGAAVSTLLKESHGESILCFGEGNDTKSLIADNQTLLFTTDEILNDGFKFIKELESM